MARGITVHREDGVEAMLDEPLGSESAVRERWSTPAATLGLPLIASIDDHGFYRGIRWAGPQLAQVMAELAVLEDHWASIGLPPDVAADLAERAGHLRTALTLAGDCGGFVAIS